MTATAKMMPDPPESPTALAAWLLPWLQRMGMKLPDDKPVTTVDQVVDALDLENEAQFDELATFLDAARVMTVTSGQPDTPESVAATAGQFVAEAQG